MLTAAHCVVNEGGSGYPQEVVFGSNEYGQTLQVKTYKAHPSYDPNAFVGFFGKVMDEERRSPGSMAKVFADHPPTGDRIIASEEEIQKILPKRPEYLVSTSEFDDIKSRMQTVMTQHKRQQKGESGPTLRKKESTDKTTTDTNSKPSKTDSGDDQPPVLKRRD